MIYSMPPLTLRNFVGDIRCLPVLLVFAGFSGQEKGCWQAAIRSFSPPCFLPGVCVCVGSLARWLAVLGQTLCFGWRIFRFLVARARCKLIFVAVCLPCRRLVTAGTQACGRFSPFLCLFFFCASFPYAAAAFAAFVAAAAAAAD